MAANDVSSATYTSHPTKFSMKVIDLELSMALYTIVGTNIFESRFCTSGRAGESTGVEMPEAVNPALRSQLAQLYPSSQR
jgi:hypothetical protein